MNAAPFAPAAIAWGPDGLVPVVIVDDRTGAVLTLAYANREALERTIADRSTWLYSRSRGELWHKGGTSGNTQQVIAIAADCDTDALIYRVLPSGPACHTGQASCFGPEFRLDGGENRSIADGVRADGPASAAEVRPEGPAGAVGIRAEADADSAAGGERFAGALAGLAATIAQRKRAPAPDSYTSELFAGGVDRIGKKIGEEATEVVIAAKNADRGELIWETADLLYHTLVLLAQREIALDEVGAELTRRAAPKT